MPKKSVAAGITWKWAFISFTFYYCCLAVSQFFSITYLWSNSGNGQNSAYRWKLSLPPHCCNTSNKAVQDILKMSIYLVTLSTKNIILLSNQLLKWWYLIVHATVNLSTPARSKSCYYWINTFHYSKQNEVLIYWSINCHAVLVVVGWKVSGWGWLK